MTTRHAPKCARPAAWFTLALALVAAGCRLSDDGLSGAAPGAAGAGGVGSGGSAGSGSGNAGSPATGAGGSGGTVMMSPDAGPLPCSGATGVGKAPGQSCACAGECATGFCVDGVCCQEACGGACRACAAGTGRCELVAAGQRDPRRVCAEQPASTCGTTGLCGAQGVCARHAAGTACGAAGACDGTAYRAAGKCDERGSCVAADVDCTPYKCANASCRTSCDVDADCAPGLTCQAHVCEGPRAIGGACNSASQCVSGFCVDGVCCDSACEGTCRSCALANNRGRCSMVPAQTAAARGECAPQAASTCGRDGTCNGVGQCALQPSGTTCDPGGCSDATSRAPSTCNGAGQCAAGATKACAPYLCGGTGQCLDRCGADASCAFPNVCVLGRCASNPVLDVAFTSKPPKSDGVADPIWATAAAQPITHVVFGSASSTAPASFRALWSTAGLHLLIVVPDAQRINDDPGIDSYDDDAVEVYVDADGSRGTTLDGVNDHHFLFGYKDKVPANVSLHRLEGIEFDQAESPEGYAMEITLPWTTLGVPAKAGAVIGLDVHVDDDDDGGSRDRKLSWFGTEDVAFRDPSSYGRIRLAP